MRIAQISTVCTPVRAKNSGSVEAHVWLLARELTRLGHEVTVFACAGSEVDGELVTSLPGPYGKAGSPDDWKLCEWLNICRALEEAERFDVLHSHAYLWSLPAEKLSKKPVVHTAHVMPGADQAYLWSQAPGACVTALSRFQWSALPRLQPAAVIPHGVDAAQFTFRAEPDDYACFFGRFSWGKGPLHAIEAARAAGVRLRLAGPRNAYYDERVAPLVDGVNVEYVGSVSGQGRDALLGGARALLYPVQEPEPFGLVLAEAMMCGTPVVATGIGAVPEIVEEGITGYLSTCMDELPALLTRSFGLDRNRVRQRAQARFSAEQMALDYARLYERLAGGKS